MTLPGVELTTALADLQPRRHALRMSPLLDPLFVDSTSGVSGGEVSVVLGAPGVGKSRLAMQWLSWVCRQYGTPGLYVSTDGEMAASQVIELAQALGALDAGIYLEGASISIPHSVWHPDELYSVISSLRSAPVPVPVVVDSLLGLATTWRQEQAVRSLKEAAVLGNAAVMLLAGNHAVGSGAGPRSLLHPADAALRVTLTSLTLTAAASRWLRTGTVAYLCRRWFAIPIPVWCRFWQTDRMAPKPGMWPSGVSSKLWRMMFRRCRCTSLRVRCAMDLDVSLSRAARFRIFLTRLAAWLREPVYFRPAVASGWP